MQMHTMSTAVAAAASVGQVPAYEYFPFAMIFAMKGQRPSLARTDALMETPLNLQAGVHI